MKYAFTLLMILLAGQVAAQGLPPVQKQADVDAVRSGIGEEPLAPVATKPRVVSVTVPAAVAKVSTTSVSASTVVSTTDMFTVKNLVVTLSGTTGFDRDAALEQGARQAMPGVLVAMGMDKDVATKSVKALGSAMTFVKTFKVVKETLIPTYVLTTDLTFNEAMLRKNFGSKLVVKGAEVSATTEVSGTEEVPVAAPLKQWVVRVVDRDPAAVEKVRTNLNAQPATKATYRLLTSAGAEMVVDTPMNAMEINRVAGHEVMVSELETALPTPVAGAVGLVSGSWQGDDAAVSGTAVEGSY